MTIVKWGISSHFKNINISCPQMEVVFNEPEHFLKSFAKERTKAAYMRCPAFLDFSKNVYVIRAPFDMDITIDRSKQYMTTNFSQEVYDAYCQNRGHEVLSENDPYLITLPPNYIFYADESVMMESIPAYLHKNTSIDNLRLIPGTYDIGQWFRPVDYTVEIVDDTKPIKIKRDDVLFYIRFVTKDGSKVELERFIIDDHMNRVMYGCVQVKHQVQTLTLETLYQKAKPFLDLMLRRKPKKCPFKFWSK